MSGSLGSTEFYAFSSYEPWMASRSLQQALHLQMMKDAFPMMDNERKELAQKGPWTGRTDRLDRYAVVDTWA